MNYNEHVLAHFFQPKNVGSFLKGESAVGRGVVGRYENGALIHFQIKVANCKVIAAKFKAYGNCLIIAACSYATEWLENRSIAEAKSFDHSLLIEHFAIPDLKLHAALLVEDAIRAAVHDYEQPDRFVSSGK